MANPDLETFEKLAEQAWHAIPRPFREIAGRVRVQVEEEADPETLADLGIIHPVQLSGLYVGVPMIDDSVTHPFPYDAQIFLYRRSILAEWKTLDDVSLAELISHVLVHELGHHFGWSDEEMDEILARTEE